MNLGVVSEHGCHHVGVQLPGVEGGGAAGELEDGDVVHVDATELLVCNVDNDILIHGDNLAKYDHNDITGLLNPALPPSTLLLKRKRKPSYLL